MKIFEKTWHPKGARFEKNQINFLIMHVRVIGHKISYLEIFFLEFFENQATKMMSFKGN